MVLKDSKWDRKAKRNYEKKHGIVLQAPAKAKDTPKARWSGKKAVEPESDDEWDSDVDGPLLEHFYPSMSEDSHLTRDQKLKLKKQIIADIQRQLEEEALREEQPEVIDRSDGIYLGSDEAQQVDDRRAVAARAIKEAREQGTGGGDGQDKKFNMADFLNDLQEKLSQKNRRMPTMKNVADIEEYGLSHRDLIKSTDDYDDLYQKSKTQRSVNQLTNDELRDYVIGTEFKLDSRGLTVELRSLTPEEIAEQRRRDEIALREARFRKLKQKLTADGGQAKAIEVNNFDNDDEEKVAWLGLKIEDNGDVLAGDWEDDLSQLLGLKLAAPEDEHIANVSRTAKLAKPPSVKGPPPSDTQFLDDLLG